MWGLLGAFMPLIQENLSEVKGQSVLEHLEPAIPEVHMCEPNIPFYAEHCELGFCHLHLKQSSNGKTLS